MFDERAETAERASSGTCRRKMFFGHLAIWQAARLSPPTAERELPVACFAMKEADVVDSGIMAFNWNPVFGDRT